MMTNPTEPTTLPVDDFDDDEVDDVVTFDEWRTEQPELLAAVEPANPRRQLGRALASLRSGRGLTQRQLAAMLDKQQPAIARIENGTTNVGWETVYEILNALGVTFSFAFAEQEPELIPRAVLVAQLEAEFKRGFSEGMVASAASRSPQVIRTRNPAKSRNAI
ncbi:MAG: Helix-turn-helix domain [Thermoleophilia bacterium]|nr:Helix-turn-helix domain [Thermoleophilia bacterium]